MFDNHNKPELLATQVQFIIGNGPVLYTEQYDDKGNILKVPTRDAEIEAFFRKVKIKKYLRRQAWNYALFGNTLTEILLNQGRKAHSLKSQDCIFGRAEKISKDTGRIENWFLCGDWKKPKKGDNGNIKRVPAYDEDDPLKYSKCMFHAREGIPGNLYYDPVRWYGTRNWTKVANVLPVWHLNGINNGYNLTYHIQIPQDYFIENYPEEERAAAEEKLYQELDNFLSGAENPQKAFISKYGKTYDGKPTDGWIIAPIKNERDDGAYSKQFEQSNQANTSGHGIAPSLAGIETAGKLSSGSEMRNAFNIYQTLKTPTAREVLVEPLEAVGEINGWNPEIKIGFRDMILTTLDKDHSGKKEKVN